MLTTLGQGVLLAALLGVSPGAPPEFGSCPAPSFQCEDDRTCLEPDRQCDGVPDCQRHEEGTGGEDEDDCHFGSGQELPDCDPDLAGKPDKPSVQAEELSNSRVKCSVQCIEQCAVCSV